jgi:hypothetical protein
VPAEYEVSVAEEARREMTEAKLRKHYRDLWKRFPTKQVMLPKVTITYQAHGITVPVEPIEEICTVVKDPVKLFTELTERA